jgi:hypothetical protein
MEQLQAVEIQRGLRPDPCQLQIDPVERDDPSPAIVSGVQVRVEAYVNS